MNVVSKEPSLFNLAILFRAVPLILVNSPPTRIFPSVWTSIDLIGPFAPVPDPKEDISFPKESSFAIMPRFVPPIEVKSPAIRTAPDESVVSAYILPGLDPVRTSPTEKVGSIAPVCENALKLFPKK